MLTAMISKIDDDDDDDETEEAGVDSGCGEGLMAMSPCQEDQEETTVFSAEVWCKLYDWR